MPSMADLAAAAAAWEKKLAQQKKTPTPAPKPKTPVTPPVVVQPEPEISQPAAKQAQRKSRSKTKSQEVVLPPLYNKPALPVVPSRVGLQPYQMDTSGQIPPHNEGVSWAPGPVTMQAQSPAATQSQRTPARPQATKPTAAKSPSGGGSRGGGGGGSGGSSVTPGPTVGATNPLFWWNAEQIPPMLRDWMRYLRELVEMNQAATPVPYPFVFDPTAEALANQNATPGLAGMMTNAQRLQQLMALLGIGALPAESAPQTQWQTFINAIPLASMGAQQQLAGLRYDPAAGWYFEEVDQLQNPEYL